ncbi:thioesterase II family protein [Lysinibacillus xylanilyticus]|uniref:thioesterase II family protein n=1 Tax=Lysinibacillus xylanilyticus TaxID=582475 RepID=UPI0037FDCAA1
METKIQIVALPYAVGSLRSYYSMSKISEIELVKYEVPGRGTRLSESISSMRSIIEEILKNIDFNRPYILFGHSMGAYITYEVCSIIEEKNFPLPFKVILSAQVPPGKSRIRNMNSIFTHQESVEYFEHLGGTPKEVIENSELIELFSGILSHDLSFLKKYLMTGWTEKIKSNLEIWYGEGDNLIQREDILLWEIHTLGQCKFMPFSGNHFFINELLQSPDILKRKLLAI